MQLQIPEPAPYTFPAVSLAQRRSIPLAFRRIEGADRDWLAVVWKDMANAVRKAHQLTATVAPRWTNWQPWQWCFDKSPLGSGRTSVMGWADGVPVGFLNLWLSPGASPSLYIEHVAATPGDISTQLWGRRYHGVGYSLFAYAIHVSRGNGCAGRVGLHAETAEVRQKVYGRYERDVPGLFRPDASGIPGQTDYGPRKNLSLTYLETTEVGAGQLLEGFRNA